MQDKTVALETSPAQPAEEELNPFLIFPQPEENFKVPNSLVCFFLFSFFTTFHRPLLEFACTLSFLVFLNKLQISGFDLLKC